MIKSVQCRPNWTESIQRVLLYTKSFQGIDDHCSPQLSPLSSKICPLTITPSSCSVPVSDLLIKRDFWTVFLHLCLFYSSEGSNKLSNATVSPKIVDNLKNLPELFSITFNNQLALSLFYCFIETIEEPYKRNLYCLWVKHIALVYIVWVGKKKHTACLDFENIGIVLLKRSSSEHLQWNDFTQAP